MGWTPRGGRVAPGPEVTWAFDWRHGQPRVHIRRVAEGESEIHRIEIVTRVSGRPVTFRFTHDGPGRASIVADGLSDSVQSLGMPILGRGDLAGLQLAEPIRDRLFESSVGLARTMAEAVL